MNNSSDITILKRSLYSLTMALSVLFCGPLSATADDVAPPYDRLNLNVQQSQEIHSLDDQWNQKYMELQPQLLQTQRRLYGLLSSPKSDPLEISTTQQRVNHLKEQLQGFATANYLKKRRLLNSPQQQVLEGWIKRMVADKQRGQRL